MSGDWLVLDVGGKRMSTTRATLTSCPGSVLARMFDTDSGLEPARVMDGAYTIDTDPDHFKVILNWLRYKQVSSPLPDMKGLTMVAEYFGLEPLVEQLKTLDHHQVNNDHREDELVRLDVGGKQMMTTTKRTFFRMSTGVRNRDDFITEKSDGSYFIDLEPDHFHTVLLYYRSGAIVLPQDFVGRTDKRNALEFLYKYINIDSSSRDHEDLLKLLSPGSYK